MANVPTEDTTGTDPDPDDYFEEEYDVTAAEAGEFLVELGEQLQSGEGDLTITGGDWELDFAYGDAVELEVEYVSGPDGELEVEVELSAAGDESPPSLG
ncbi:amphi-Trp domain-containing protein [Haloplanus salilacus]|uniref:amphi-Trp domain-containing protein n=1 Tax=Haloplanus salilacus TaxID=2949994 RepID=UPI0030D3A214